MGLGLRFALGFKRARSGQGRGDGCALANVAIDIDAPSVQFHEGVDQIQAEPTALVVAGVDIAYLLERLKNPFVHVFRNAVTGIADGDACLVVVGRVDFQSDVSAFGRKLDGVGQQVEHHLFDAHFIGIDVRHVVSQIETYG